MDAHENEYLAAAAAIGEQTPSPRLRACNLPAVGDRVTYRLKGWSDCSSESGRIRKHAVSHDGRDMLVVEVEDEPGTLRVVDPRPWPTGAMLPF